MEYILSEVKNRIDAHLRQKDRVLVAIDGNSGAGKSTLAAQLKKQYSCNLFHMDDFFLPKELKTKERLLEAGGNVHYERFLDEVIGGIISGNVFEYQTYNCSIASLDKTIKIDPNRLNIIEGVYSCHPVLMQYYDLKIFLKVSEKEQSKRILNRNGAFMHQRFIEEWIPLENMYFNKMHIESLCDPVFDVTTGI